MGQKQSADEYFSGVAYDEEGSPESVSASLQEIDDFREAMMDEDMRSSRKGE